MYKILIKHISQLFFLYTKMSTEQCQKNKERLQKKVCERYFSEKEKNKIQKYGRKRYKNFYEEEKDKRLNTKNILYNAKKIKVIQLSLDEYKTIFQLMDEN